MTRRLLVVDDATIIRKMIKRAASDGGWSIAGEATNGFEAIQKFQELRPDAVTLDLVMPECDGLRALREIRKLDDRARVLVVSALDESEVLEQALHAGASGFIVKPFEDTIVVIDALNNIVPGDRATDVMESSLPCRR